MKQQTGPRSQSPFFSTVFLVFGTFFILGGLLVGGPGLQSGPTDRDRARHRSEVIAYLLAQNHWMKGQTPGVEQGPFGVPASQKLSLSNRKASADKTANGFSEGPPGSSTSLNGDSRGPASLESQASFGLDPWGKPFYSRVDEDEGELLVSVWSSSHPEVGTVLRIPRGPLAAPQIYR